MIVLAVMAGAGLGAIGRWLVGRYTQARHGTTFPWGTLAVNVLGSLALGGLLAAASVGSIATPTLALLGTGICGGFTTFSSFGYETVRLAQDGPAGRARAVANVAVNLGLGLGAAAIGWQVVLGLM